MINNEESVVQQREDRSLLGERGRGSLRICGRIPRDVLAAAIACIGAMSMGFALGYSSPALDDPELKKILDTDDRKSWFGSLVTVGAIVGGPLGAFAVVKLGRKTTLMLCNLPFAIGWFLVAYASSVVLLYFGRICVGLGVGAVSLAAPVYVAEVSMPERRGMLGSGFQLLVTVGIFVSYALGALISWSWLAVAGTILAFCHCVLLLAVPEAPRWLLVKRDRSRALRSLMWLRNTENVDAEFSEMDDAVTQSNLDGSDAVTVRSFLLPSVYKPLLISLGLMIFQQFSGVNAVIFYTHEIFVSAGFNSNPSMPTIIVGAVLVVSTIVSCILADLAGRRILLIVSGVLMTISIAVLGVYFYVTENHLTSVSLGWLSLTSMMVYIAFFSVGWGPIPWLVMSEIFPARVRGVACGLATCVNWAAAFITTKEFMALESVVNSYGAFWGFSGVCLLGVVFVIFVVIETRGRSLDDIETYFRGSD